MYIPDLFGAYVKGRELAIAKNWDDLKNYENIEAARNANDLSAMDVWERRQQMPGKMSMFYDNVNQSQRANQVADAAHRGLLANANLGSDVAVGRYGIYKQHEDDYLSGMSSLFGERIAQVANKANALRGTNDYVAPRAYEIGQMQGQTGYNQVVANNIIGENLPNDARQRVALSVQSGNNNYKAGELQGKRLDTAIDHHPLVAGNEKYSLESYIPDMKRRREIIAGQTSGGLQDAEVSSYISAAMAGDAGAVWWLAKHGLAPDGSPLQTAQAPVAPQATPQAPVAPNTLPATAPVVTTPAGSSSIVRQVLDMFQGRQPYPVAPNQGTYMPTAGARSLVSVPPINTTSPYLNLAPAVGVSYLPAVQVVK